MLLVLISANILNHTASVEDSTDKGCIRNQVVLKAVLGYSRRVQQNGIPAYAMFDDYYWFRVKVLNPVVRNV